ncbi:MAG TPA: protein kinase [Thermoanaerobaculia bacterium]
MNALEGGSSVGRYRIEKFLGAGAMGEVYLALDPQIDRKLAIKTVRLAGRPQEIDERKKRLLREARAAGRLLHPNIVTLFDAGEAEGLLYLAFELVEGTDLGARLEAGERPSLRQVLRIVRQAAEALDYAHGQGIVHRDIKPSNLLLDPAGRVKVADFGIAKMAGQSTELTVAGSVMGSPQYLSPEQVRGDDLDGRSDLFSLGVVLYELLSGQRPFNGETITTLVYQILHMEPPPVSELRAVPPRLEELLRRMLAKDRDDRIAAAGEVARELTFIEGELTEETLSAPAGAGPFEATKLLPRQSAAATAPAMPPPPPVLRSTRGTVPASPPTTPSVPPPLPVTPPPPPMAPAPAAPSSRSALWVVIPVVAVLLIAAGLGAWFLFLRPRTQSEVPPQTAQSVPALPAATPGGATGTAASVPSSTPSQTPAQVPSAPGPAVKPGTRPPANETAKSPATPSASAARQPEPSPPRDLPAVPPVAETRREPEPPVREPEPAPAPAPAAMDADRSLRTGLQVAFRVVPPDAFVLVDRTNIGMAREWSGLKGARTYTFPGPGSYLVKLKKDGMKEYHIAVEASATGGTTSINASLQPLPAAEVDASDLPAYRVREAVAFRVQPPGAEVLVDGQPMGPARRFSGGGLLRGKGEWLELAPGKYRISLTSPGFRRKDISVEVVATADKERERINVTLVPGGGG